MAENNFNSEPDWQPPMPPVPDENSIGRGSYRIGEASIVVSIDKDEVEGFSNHTTVPSRD